VLRAELSAVTASLSESAAQVTTLKAQVDANQHWKMRRDITQLQQKLEAERKRWIVELEAERKEREALVSTFAVSLAQAESENDVASSVAAAARQLQLNAATEAVGRKEFDLEEEVAAWILVHKLCDCLVTVAVPLDKAVDGRLVLLVMLVARRAGHGSKHGRRENLNRTSGPSLRSDSPGSEPFRTSV